MSLNKCSVEGCGRVERLLQNYCCLHYARWKRHGDPLVNKRRELSMECIKTRIEISTAGCWNWLGALNSSGYAWVRWKGKSRALSRVVWMLMTGAIPDGLLVLHKCDNRRCVNPDHLFLGTNADNMADMVQKGRSPRSRAKLSISDVLAIRSAAGVSYSLLAEKYGVSPPTIYYVATRRTWRHI